MGWYQNPCCKRRWFQRLKLQYDETLPNVAVMFNLRIYSKDCALLALVAKPWLAVVVANNLPRAKLKPSDFVGSVAMLACARVGRCRLHPPQVDPSFIACLVSALDTTARRTAFELCLQFNLHRYTKANGWCPWNARTCALIAAGEHLDVLLWAREHGCREMRGPCSGAALGGDLEVLQYARQDDCPWDVWTCAGAASLGRLDMLKWARQNGCPWDAMTCKAAAAGGHLEVLKWVWAHGCPWESEEDDDDSVREVPMDCCDLAAESGHLEVLKWLREQQFPWTTRACTSAARQGLTLVRFSAQLQPFMSMNHFVSIL